MGESLASWLSSRGLAVEQRDGRGRCLVALRAFAAGDLLLEQAPYAAVLLDGAAACDVCGRVPQGGAAELKRCSRCRVARYCGADCQKEAWVRGTHARECPALAALAAAQRRVPPPSLRLAHRILLRRAAQAAAPAPPPCSEAPELVDVMVSHRSDATQDALLAAAQMATLLSSYAGTRRVADPEVDDVAAAAAAEATHRSEAWRLDIDVAAATELLLALSCNAHSVCDAELRPLGRAVYPVVACANHSCMPAAALTFRGLRAQLRALAPLRAGEEITIAYVDVCATAAQRRAELRRGYYFSCACVRCTAALARGGSGDDKALGGVACDACGAALPDGDESAACTACAAPAQPLPPRAAALAAATRRLDEQLAVAKEAGACGDAAAARAAAAAAVRVADEAVASGAMPATAAARTRALDAATKAAVDAADFAAARLAAEGALPGYHAAHGAQPGPLLGLQWATVGRLRWAAGEGEAAAEAYERALACLRVSHGADHQLVGELAQSSREAQAEAAHQARARELE